MNAAVLTLALLGPSAPPQPAAPDVSLNVKSGLKYLAGKQKDDGTWEANEGQPPTIITTTAALALLMEGSTLKDGPYAPHLRKVVAWLEKHVGDDGRLTSGDPNEMFQYIPGHATALLFLSCVYDVDDDAERSKRIAKLINKGITFLAESQTAAGAWGFVKASENSNYDDGQSTATVLQALFAARKAGFDVPRKLTDGGVRYLVKSTARDGGVVYSIFGGMTPEAQGNVGQPMITASAAAGVLMAEGSRPETLPRWVKSANTASVQQMPNIRNNGAFAMIQQYQMARVCYALGEHGHGRLEPSLRDAELVTWSKYRSLLFKTLKETQAKDGSWADQFFGPAYNTAMALIILQLDKDHLPAFSR
jgi:hypothetical protein